jgi:hypothetical protein
MLSPRATLPLKTPLSEPDRCEALECLAHLHWEGITRPTIIRILIFLGNLINNYRNAWQQTPEDRMIGNPIYIGP